MAKIITIANQKGGTGKTTTALCLGAELEQKGFKVLYIDLDTQGNLSFSLRNSEEHKNIKEIFKKNNACIDVKELIQVNDLKQNFISAGEDLNTTLNTISDSVGKEYRLKESIKPILKQYDFILIDTAPGLNLGLVNALSCSDYLIIVVNADRYSLRACDDIQAIVESVKAYTNKKLKVGGLLVNKYKQRQALSQQINDILEEVAKEYKTKVFNTHIRECVAISESQAVQQPITTYAPKSNGNIDYLSFTEEVLKDLKG